MVGVLGPNYSIHTSGTGEYHDLEAKYRLVTLCKFLRSLDKAQMEQDRDEIILNLLYYTTKDKYEMVEVLEGYIGGLE